MTTVHGDWLLTPQRAAVHLPTATAVVADLHLGYDAARNRGGDAVPVRDLTRSLTDLAALAAAYPVRRLVIAGDLLESQAGRSLLGDFQARLARAGVELAAVVPGNHDRSLVAADVPLFRDGFEVDGWRVVHGDGKLPGTRVVLGHFHPCVRWQGRYATPCYLVASDVILLPAFSRDAAGVNVLRRRAWQAHECHAIAGGRVLSFGRVAAIRRSCPAAGEALNRVMRDAFPK
jgi:putative SbcD/Mre11-related phosphoesterase